MIKNYKISRYKCWYNDYETFFLNTPEENKQWATNLGFDSVEEFQSLLEKHCFCIELMRINQIKYLKKLIKADRKKGEYHRADLVEKWNNMTIDEALKKMVSIIKERKWVTSKLKEERKAEDSHIAKYMMDLLDNDIVFDLPQYRWKIKEYEIAERDRFKNEWAKEHDDYALAVRLDEAQKDAYPMEIWYPPSFCVGSCKWRSVFSFDKFWLGRWT